MSALITVLLWIVLTLLALVALILLLVVFIPFGVSSEGEIAQDRADGLLTAWWAWGLVGVKLQRGKSGLYLLGLRVLRFRRGEEKPEKEEKPELKKKTRVRAKRRLVFRDGGTMVRMAIRLLATLKVRGSLVGTMGFEDPADTAIAVTLLEQIDQRTKWLDLSISADWTEEALDLRGCIGMQIWVAHLVAVFLALLFNRVNRRVVRALIWA